MGAIRELDPLTEFEIFTLVPRWFFKDSLSDRFVYHSYRTDIGLVQETPLRADIQKTLYRLDHFLPFDSYEIAKLASILKQRKCRLVLCDIAPMGILAAREARIPSVLVENFTWDWIYEEYLKEEPRMGNHIPYLRRLFDMADVHIQTEPVCHRSGADLTAPPASRKPINLSLMRCRSSGEISCHCL